MVTVAVKGAGDGVGAGAGDGVGAGAGAADGDGVDTGVGDGPPYEPHDVADSAARSVTAKESRFRRQ
jgi:hypothetical protein